MRRSQKTNRPHKPAAPRLRRGLGLLALLLLAAVAAYLWTAPMRAESALRRAALPELAVASRQHPGDLRIAYYLGLRLRQSGQDQAALTAFQRAATLAPNDEKAWLAWASTAGAVQGDQEAFAILSLFLKNQPRSAPAHFALALLYDQKDAPRPAYAEAQTAAGLDPRDAAAWVLAGTEALKLRNTQDAEAAMRRAVALRPADWRSRSGLGNALYEEKRYPEARACYEEAVRLAPGEAVAHLGLGRVLLQMAVSPADYDAAREQLQRAAALQPALPLTYLYLGQSDARQARWPEARDALVQAERLEPGNAQVHFELSGVYRHLGQSAAADREARLHQSLTDYRLEKASLRDRASATGDPQTRLKQARLLAGHGDDVQAADLYRSLLAQNPKMESSRRELAALEHRSGQGSRQSVSLPMPP